MQTDTSSNRKFEEFLNDEEKNNDEIEKPEQKSFKRNPGGSQ